MSDILNKLVNQALQLHKQGRFQEAEVIYNRVLSRDPFHEELLFLLSDLYLRREFNGLAVNLLSGVVERNPKNAAAWCNLGIGYRKENDYEKAVSCWNRAIAVGGETEAVCNNLAGLYADRARPEKALHWVNKALAINPEGVESNWQKSLALLTLGQWDEGWKQYAWRKRLSNWDSREMVDAPQWDGAPVETLYIHGEQGVGDEIMFASAIPHILGLAKHITLEVNGKVAGIVKQTWPQFRVVKEAVAEKFDAKCPIGDLVRMFGTNTKPYLEPHPEKVAFYRRELQKLGPGPYVAVTWLGGTRQTRVEDRTLHIEALQPILKAFTCVSAQYSDACPIVEEDRIRAGLPRINAESAGGDLHDQAALFKAVDAVVTVQQTAVHVAGAVGAKTFAIIGDKPHWRYGITGDSLPFYSTVRLFRKVKDWNEPIERVLHALDRELQRTEPQAA